MDLNSFIDNEKAKKLEIIKFLKMSEDYKTNLEIANEVSIDRKTTKKYLDELLVLEKEKNIKIFDIKKRKGYKINSNSKIDYLFFKKCIYESCFNINFLAKLWVEDINLVDLMNEYHISEAFINKKMVDLRKLLKPYGLKVRFRKGHFTLEGFESDIRFFYFLFFWNFSRGSDWVFKGVSEDELLKLINDYANTLDIPFSGCGRMQLAYFLAISIIRFNRKKRIPENFFDKGYEQTFKRIGKETGIKSKWFTYINRSEVENNYFLLFLSTKTTFFMKYSNIFLDNKETLRKNRSWLATEEVISYMNHNIINLTTDQNKELKKYIYPINLYAEFFYETIDLSETPIEKSAAKYLVKTIKIFKVLCNELNIKTGYSIFEKTDFLIKNYILAWEKIKKINFFEPKISILLETDSPYSEKKIILKRISDIIQLHYNAKIYDKFEANKIENYDVLITTTAVNYSEVIPKLRYDHLIHVNREITVNDYKRIHRLLFDIYTAKNEREMDSDVKNG